MKTLASSLCLLVITTFARLLAADPGSRNDINPALIYGQAIALLPDRSAQDHLFTNEWRGRDLDEQFGKQIATYDNAFKLLRQAPRQKVPCDWGYDLTQGPELLLPGLPKAKSLAQAARLRVRWHLENGRPDDARDDLLAAFVLGRQVSKDGILISALVQIAIESILDGSIAENWFRLSPETLQQIMDGIAAAPARGTMAQCVPTERLSFKDWLAHKIEGIQTASHDEAEALQKTRDLLRSIMGGGDAPEGPAGPTPEAIIQAAGGTTAGLLRQLKELDALYDEAGVLMTVPYGQFLPGIKAFNEKIAKHPNLLARDFFPAFEKCRLKEFAIETKLAMLRAARTYRLSGEAGLGQVLDPLSNDPFQFRRFAFGGVDRGFELRSKVVNGGIPQVLIFLEKDGPAFQLEGPNAGKAVK
jgi:hypothetical protein